MVNLYTKRTLLSFLIMDGVGDQKRIYDNDVWEFKTVLDLIEAG